VQVEASLLPKISERTALAKVVSAFLNLPTVEDAPAPLGTRFYIVPPRSPSRCRPLIGINHLYLVSNSHNISIHSFVPNTP
jgi:hypothetical protein